MLAKFNIIMTSFIACLLLFAWLTPNHYMPWLTSHSEFAVFSAVLCGGVYLIINQKNLQLPIPILFFSLLAMLPFIYLAFNQNIFFGDAFISSVYISGFSLTFFIAYNIAKDNALKINAYILLSSLLIIASLISIYMALSQWLLLPSGSVFIIDLPPNARPFANFAQPNTFSTFLCMGLMAVILLYEKKYLNPFSSGLLAGLIIFGIALTQSRTSWIFALAFVVWWFWKSKHFQTRVKTWQVFTFLTWYIASMVLLPILSSFLGVVSTSDVLTRATTGYLRIPMWHQMLLAIKDEPLWGYGWNQVSVAQLTVYLDYPTTEWIEHSHNILLDLLIWNGIPIGLLIIAFLVWWLYRLSMLATCIESFIALSMVGVVLVHAMLEFPLEYAFFLFPVGFLLGLVQAEDKNIKVMNIPKVSLGIFLGISIILYFWVFIEYRAIEKDVQLVRFESLNIGKYMQTMLLRI